MTPQQPTLTNHPGQNHSAALQQLLLNWTAGSAEAALLSLENTSKTKQVLKNSTSGARSTTASILEGVFA